MLKSVARLSEHERRRILLGVAALLVLLAAIVVLLNGPGSPVGLSGCDSITLATQRYSCISTLALAEGNASMCAAMPEPDSGACALAVENSTGKASACSVIGNASQYRYGCVMHAALASRNQSDCGLLAQAQRDQCVYELAKSENFSVAGVCGSISGTGLSDTCTSVVDYRRAISHANATYCAPLPGTPNATVLAAMLGDGNGSFGIAFDYDVIGGAPRDYCYSQLALQENNASLCSLITATYVREECNSSVAYASGRLNITNITRYCSDSMLIGLNATLAKELSPVLRLACATGKAVVAKNVTICSELSNESQQYQCIISYAHDLNDSGVCGSIPNVSESQACVTDSSGYRGAS